MFIDYSIYWYYNILMLVCKHNMTSFTLRKPVFFMDRFFNIAGIPGAVVLSSLILLFALILAAVYRRWDRTLCFTAMFCSTVGDMFNAGFAPLTQFFDVNAVMTGALCFLFAHLLYISAFLYQIRKKKYKLLNPGFYTGCAVFVVSLIVLIVLAARNPYLQTSMLILGVIYLVIISANCAAIFSLAYSQKGVKLFGAAGALSFFLSDFILGISMIGGIYSALLWSLNWWFYPIGQILILIAG